MPVTARTPQELRDKLRKVSALFDGAKTDGEREAARAAMQRLEEALGHYGRQKTGRTKTRKKTDPRSSAEILEDEWHDEWLNSFKPGHKPSPSFTDALKDYLDEFANGLAKPETKQHQHGTRSAYPNAYDRRK